MPRCRSTGSLWLRPADSGTSFLLLRLTVVTDNRAIGAGLIRIALLCSPFDRRHSVCRAANLCVRIRVTVLDMYFSMLRMASPRIAGGMVSKFCKSNVIMHDSVHYACSAVSVAVVDEGCVWPDDGEALAVLTGKMNWATCMHCKPPCCGIASLASLFVSP